MGYSAKIVLDSVGPRGSRLTTMEVVFPRFILAEFNAHRVFSRNSASSRAIPTKKIIERIIADPAGPFEWGTNKPGMQAGEPLETYTQIIAQEEWHNAVMVAIDTATALEQLGIHKQVVNRVLEPFMWHTVIVSSTEWQNFFIQRRHPDAQPEMRHIAEMMWEVYTASIPSPLEIGEWHTPYIQDDEWSLGTYFKRQLSVARCARVSFLTHDGTRDRNQDYNLYDRLIVGNHMSPFEHVASPASDSIYNMGGNFGPEWVQFRKVIES